MSRPSERTTLSVAGQASCEGATTGSGNGTAPATGGLVVVTGYGEERLGYLAGLVSESLPRAFWASPPESDDGERELRLALVHLRSGTSVVQVVETDHHLGRFRELAERAGARFLLVRVLPPLASGQPPGLPTALAEDGPLEPCVLLQTSTSLATQLEVVLTAWRRPRSAP